MMNQLPSHHGCECEYLFLLLFSFLTVKFGSQLPSVLACLRRINDHHTSSTIAGRESRAALVLLSPPAAVPAPVIPVPRPIATPTPIVTPTPAPAPAAAPSTPQSSTSLVMSSQCSPSGSSAIIKRKGRKIRVKGMTQFPSVRTQMCVSSGRWYYEVRLGSSGIMQIGWCASWFEPTEGMG